MDRADMRNEIRATIPTELSGFSDTYLDNIINRGVQYVGRQYPFPVSIVDLATDGATPAWAEEFHWLVVEWVVATLFMNMGQAEAGLAYMERFDTGIREMIRFYTGGRT